jgi:magnesium and cobalt exporter, CNNM family
LINTALLLFSLLALAVACLAATSAHSFRDFSRSHLRELLRLRGQVQRYDEIAELHPRAALGAESVRVFATGAAVLAAGAYLWNSQAPLEWPMALAVNIARIVVGAMVLWLAIVWLPTALAKIWAESIIARTWRLWNFSGKLFAPSAAGSQFVERAFHRLSGKQPPVTNERELEEEIREVVTEGQREGLIEDEAREMIESVMTLGDVSVSEIMTPRTDMISLAVDADWDEALQLITRSGHTRIPVHGERRDEIVGILHIKDLLNEMVRTPGGKHRPMVELLRPAYFVPESKRVDDLLQEFQRSRNHLAVVMDEFGGVSGLVTIEDVLEEIVGEIADEHDEGSGDGIKQIDERTCEALASVRISEINQRMGLQLPEDEHFGTIGGLVFHQLGRIPHTGEEIVRGNAKIKVLDATRRRINRVAVEMLPPAEAGEESNPESDAEAEQRTAN